MPEEYVPVEYPKWVEGLVVDTAEQEAAVLEGRAIIHTVHSAAGDTHTIVGIEPKPAPAPKPLPEPDPEPEDMIQKAQRVFSRRRKER